MSIPKYCPKCGEIYECVGIAGICVCLICGVRFEYITYEPDDMPV